MASQLGDLVVVDNDADFRKMVKDALAWAGYNTLEFAPLGRPPEIEQLRPVLVLRSHLPGISGYEFCRQIRSAHGNELRVILVSGQRTEPFDRAAGILLGADDAITKPVDPGELVARVWRLFEHPNRGHADAPERGRR